MNILIISNEKVILDITPRWLEGKGHNVKTVKSYEKAIMLISSSDYDIVIADINNNIDEFKAMLKSANTLGTHPHILVISGEYDSSYKSELMLLGVYDYILKPFHIRVLFDRINAIYTYKQLTNCNNIVFLSYAKEDVDKARLLYNALSIKGYNVWFDEISLTVGQDWEAEIKEAIRKSICFIALLSKNSVSKKGYVQKELKKALDEMELLPDDETFILPVRLDECKPSYEKLNRIHWLDLYKDWTDGVNNIEKAILNKVPKIEMKCHD